MEIASYRDRRGEAQLTMRADTLYYVTWRGTETKGPQEKTYVHLADAFKTFRTVVIDLMSGVRSS